MKIHSTYSNHKSTLEAFSEVKKNLESNPKLILFFVSTNYDFNELTRLFHEHFADSEIIGLTTTGEINVNGLSEYSMSVTSWSGADLKVAGVLMDDIEKYPIFYRRKLLESAAKVGINLKSSNIHQEGLGLVFPNGLIGAEEKMLSIVNSIFPYDGFPLFGGTAGDNAKFVETLISYNGRVSAKGGAVLFLKSNDDFYLYKENIFTITNKKMKVTKASMDERIVHEFNGKKAAAEYARLLGVNVKELSNYFMTNPLGRKINDEIWIASPFQILSDGSIQFYCEIFQDSTVYILEPKSAVETIKESVENFKKQFASIEGVIGVNCILRKLQFENQKIVGNINKELAKLPNLCGFSSYGEQMNKNQLNQTMVLLGIGKRK